MGENGIYYVSYSIRGRQSTLIYIGLFKLNRIACSYAAFFFLFYGQPVTYTMVENPLSFKYYSFYICVCIQQQVKKPTNVIITQELTKSALNKQKSVVYARFQ